MGPITQFWINDSDQDLEILENLGQLFVPHLGQGRIHHQDQADGDGDVGGAHLEGSQDFGEAGRQVAQKNPRRHGQKNP